MCIFSGVNVVSAKNVFFVNINLTKMGGLRKPPQIWCELNDAEKNVKKLAHFRASFDFVEKAFLGMSVDRYEIRSRFVITAQQQQQRQSKFGHFL